MKLFCMENTILWASRSLSGIGLAFGVIWTKSEVKYISDVLAAHEMSECKPVTSSMSSTGSLSLKNDTPPADATLYRQVLGKLWMPLCITKNLVSTNICHSPN